MTSTHRVAAIVSGLCLLISPALAGATEKPAAVDARRLSAADKEPGNWMSHGRTYGEQRFSPLARSTPRTSSSSGSAWYADLDTDRGVGGDADRGRRRALRHHRLEHGLAPSTRQTGKLLWSYDPR